MALLITVVWIGMCIIADVIVRHPAKSLMQAETSIQGGKSK